LIFSGPDSHPITRTPVSVVRDGAGPCSFWQASAISQKRPAWPSRALRSVSKLTLLEGSTRRLIEWTGPTSSRLQATESASVACLYAFLVTMFAYRDYRWRDLTALMHHTVKTVTTLMLPIGFASAFGYIMARTWRP
jgi:L-lactate permease